MVSNTPPLGPVTANLACFIAMMMWATAFPAGEVLLDSWGAITLLTVRYIICVGLLVIFWVMLEGFKALGDAPWKRGLVIGGIGFGFGALLLLIGQKLSDPVTPAIAAAMMPIVGAGIEVIFDKRVLRPRLLAGILLALTGGYLATGANLSEGTFGFGALLCLVAVILFAWATRATTRNLPSLTPLGQTTITLAGGLFFMMVVNALAILTGLGESQIGETDSWHMVLMFIYAVPSLAIAQFLWIWGVGGLGILLASLHVNAVPFYVMVIVVILLDAPWGWGQAFGAALVAAGVLIAQSRNLETAYARS